VGNLPVDKIAFLVTPKLSMNFQNAEVVSSPCGTATAQANPNLAFIKFTLAKLD
jgi:hypothetical protein